MLKVATYNIRKCVGLDWRRKPERIIGVLAEIAPQIVALQEADRRFGERRGTLPAEELARTAKLRIVELPGSGASHGWHGNTILVGEDVEVRRIERLALPFLEPRGALLADLAIHGQPLRVVGLHLGLRHGSRMAQARAVIEALDQRADDALEIVMGDLNQWRGDRGGAEIISRRLAPAPTSASFHTSRPIAPIDRIFTSPELGVAEHGVHRSPLALRASDHLPVWAKLTLPGRTPPRRAAR
ncbi:endonuclease/exonuclease/phosphatase family protein [Pikeienuella sp. HZG-20]|uniref:endonuclease/exonuclease/phosphatase family protein n=1 Tax=Paludibacillus litoralis TaxID=3133267 RepID=UPI0030EE322D